MKALKIDELDPVFQTQAVFQTQGKKKETTAEGVARAAREAETQLKRYGSIARWPTVSLLGNQFQICECGHNRNVHSWNGCSLERCRRRGCDCNVFNASMGGNRGA